MAQKTSFIALLKRPIAQEARIKVWRKLVTLALHERIVAGRAYELALTHGAAIRIGQGYGITDDATTRMTTRRRIGLFVALSAHHIVVIALDCRWRSFPVAGAAGLLVPVREVARRRRCADDAKNTNHADGSVSGDGGDQPFQL